MGTDFRTAALGILLGALVAAIPATARAQAFQKGDVFATVDGGNVVWASGSGQVRKVLETGSGSIMTGVCFDLEGNLYATNFDEPSISKFDRDGRVIVRRWGGPYNSHPESCVADASGHMYTGEVDGQNVLRKFTTAGRLVATYRPQTEVRGVDWIDLAEDQCTMFYTSEGVRVMRYDVCRDRQLSDFASLGGTCYALRLRENGEVLVACSDRVYRLSPQGARLQTYEFSQGNLFAMNIDPDGAHFWTAQLGGPVFKVHIESGNGTSRAVFDALGAVGRRQPSFLDMLRGLVKPVTVGGLAIYGERTAAAAVAVRREEEARRLAEEKEREEEARRLAEEQRRREEEEARRLAEEQRRRDEEEARRLAEEQRRREEEEARRLAEEQQRRQEEEEARRQRLGRVTFGPPGTIDLGNPAAGPIVEARLDLSAELEGEAVGQVTTTLRRYGLVLEIETDEGWQALGSGPVALPIGEHGRRSWPLRLRLGQCVPGVAASDSHHVEITAPGHGQETARLRIPVKVVIERTPWARCWRPLLWAALGLAVASLMIHGFVSPSRFPPRLGVTISAEDDMSEGFFHPIRQIRGTGSGFYRDARVYVSSDHRLRSRASGAIARLRADGQGVRLQGTHGETLWRRSVDGEWERLPAEEMRARLGTTYRNDLGTVYFELRNG